LAQRTEHIPPALRILTKTRHEYNEIMYSKLHAHDDRWQSITSSLFHYVRLYTPKMKTMKSADKPLQDSKLVFQLNDFPLL